MAAIEQFVGTLSRLRAIKGEAVVIKIGGNVLPHREAFCDDVKALWQAGIFTVIVHGGGKSVTDMEKTPWTGSVVRPGLAGHRCRCPGARADGPRRQGEQRPSGNVSGPRY